MSGADTLSTVATWLKAIPASKTIDAELLGELASDIQNMTPTQAKAAIEELKKAGAVSETALRTLRALQRAAEAAAEHGLENTIVFADLLNRRGDDFRFGSLKGRYRKWASQHPAPNNTPRHFVEDMLKKDIDGVDEATRKTIVMLKGILGETPNFASKALRPQRHDMWPVFNHFRRALTAAQRQGDTAARLAAKVNSPEALTEAIEESVSHIRKIIDQGGDVGEGLRPALDALSALPPDGGRRPIEVLIENLLRRESWVDELSELDGVALARLVGRTKRAPEEIIDQLVLSHLVMRRELDAMQDMRRTFYHPDSSLLDPDQFFELLSMVEGGDGFFKTVISRTGWEHGYVFEQLLTCNILTEALRKSGADLAKASDRVIVQSRIANAEGPDLLIINVIGGVRVATIVQAKSFRSLSSLVGLTKGGSLAQASGEIASQARRDIKRLLQTGGLTQAADGAVNVGLEAFDPVIRSKIDWSRLQRETLKIDGTAVRNALEADYVDVITGKRVSDMNLDELILSKDPVISSVLRAQVKAQHLVAAEAAIAADLKTFATALADEVKLMDADTFRTTFKAPREGPHVAVYEAVTEALADPDNLDVGAAFKNYYEKFFSLSGAEGVRVEFELVDAVIDSGVTEVL